MPLLRWSGSAKRILNYKRKKVPKVPFTPLNTVSRKVPRKVGRKKSPNKSNKENDSTIQRVNDIQRLKDLASTANHDRIETQLNNEWENNFERDSGQTTGFHNAQQSPTEENRSANGRERSPSPPESLMEDNSPINVSERTPSPQKSPTEDNRSANRRERSPSPPESPIEDNRSANGSERSPSPPDSPIADNTSANGSERSPSPPDSPQRSPREDNRSANGSERREDTPSPRYNRSISVSPGRQGTPSPRGRNPRAQERDGFFANDDNEMILPEIRRDENQLLGPGDEMILLADNIFCKEDVLRRIEASSRTGTGVARRLMYGIFNPEHVLDCTLTGYRIMNQGARKKIR